MNHIRFQDGNIRSSQDRSKFAKIRWCANLCQDGEIHEEKDDDDSHRI